MKIRVNYYKIQYLKIGYIDAHHMISYSGNQPSTFQSKMKCIHPQTNRGTSSGRQFHRFGSHRQRVNGEAAQERPTGDPAQGSEGKPECSGDEASMTCKRYPLISRHRALIFAIFQIHANFHNITIPHQYITGHVNKNNKTNKNTLFSSSTLQAGCCSQTGS